MKHGRAGDFAVSIQWGAGMHYFMGYTDSRQEALACADTLYRAFLSRHEKRGAIPEVNIWQRVSAQRAKKEQVLSKEQAQ